MWRYPRGEERRIRSFNVCNICGWHPKALLSSPIGIYNARMAKRTTVNNPISRAPLSPVDPLTEPPQRAKHRSGVKSAAPRQNPREAARIAEIFSRFAAADPNPKGELTYKNPFTLLVAVVLSAQATDSGVNKATGPLFAIADTPQKMLALGEDKIREMIKTIGLYRTKAKHVAALSRQLIENFGGEVPHDRESLETLPGVGRKTANVVMNTAFGEPAIAVDTHIFRVSNRLPLAPGKTPFDVERGLERIIPDIYKLHAHHWLILHGRYICKARRPECERCIISDLCRFPGKRV
jgi:endonuclease-3